MNLNIKVIDDNHTKHPVTIEGVGYVIIDNNWIRFGKDAKNPKDSDWAIPRKGTSAKVIVWEEVTNDAQ